MAEDLKPCHWCGREATLCKKKFYVIDGTTHCRWHVIHRCRNGNYAETKLCGTKTEAIATWNRRATTPDTTCRMDETETYECVRDDGKRLTVHVMECGECGHTYEHVNGSYEFCPRCGSKVIE